MTTPPSRHERSVKRFFDDLAPSYRQKFTGRQPFLAWFFRERLRRATRGRNIAGATILDIGAGTGALYDYLQHHAASFDYYACDLSAAMLEHSNIPPARRFTGAAPGIAFPVARFDLIFALGVTSYLEPAARQEMLAWIAGHLAPGGRAILSFTNRRSLDFRLRRRLRPLVRRLGLSRGVLGQDFAVSAYATAEIDGLLPGELRVKSLHWLPPVLPPLDRWLPRLAIVIARILGRCPAAVQPFLAADFLVVLSHPEEARGTQN